MTEKSSFSIHDLKLYSHSIVACSKQVFSCDNELLGTSEEGKKKKKKAFNKEKGHIIKDEKLGPFPNRT